MGDRLQEEHLHWRSSIVIFPLIRGRISIEQKKVFLIRSYSRKHLVGWRPLLEKGKILFLDGSAHKCLARCTWQSPLPFFSPAIWCSTSNYLHQAHPTVESLGETMIEEKITEIKFDQRWHFWRSKKQEWDPQCLRPLYRANLWPWLWLAVMRQRQENVLPTITTERVCLLHRWLERLRQGLFKRAAHQREKHTICMEQNNPNTRLRLGSMAGRRKIVSRSEEMISLSMARW